MPSSMTPITSIVLGSHLNVPRLSRAAHSRRGRGRTIMNWGFRAENNLAIIENAKS